jgi:hypothetical protein
MASYHGSPRREVPGRGGAVDGDIRNGKQQTLLYPAFSNGKLDIVLFDSSWSSNRAVPMLEVDG